MTQTTSHPLSSQSDGEGMYLSYWEPNVYRDLKTSSWSKTSVKGRIDVQEWQPFLSELPKDPYVDARWKRMSWFYLNERNNINVIENCPMAQGGAYNDAATMADKLRRYPPLDKAFLAQSAVQDFIRAWANLWGIGPNEPILMQINGVRGQGSIDPLQGQGIHKDGSKYLSILVINRKNVRGAVNHLYYDKQGSEKIVETELDPGEILHIKDNKVYHSVTQIDPLDSESAWERFVIIINSAFDDQFQNRILREHFPEAVLFDK